MLDQTIKNGCHVRWWEKEHFGYWAHGRVVEMGIGYVRVVIDEQDRTANMLSGILRIPSDTKMQVIR